jgi:protein involved in polysaccharide export with SLBB domain
MKAGDVVSVLDADIIFVYGNVNKQGALKIRDRITLTQAIASAEGFLPAADKGKVRILRQLPGKAERDEFVFDLNQIDKGKVKDPMLEPNDIVAVSQDKTKAILRGIGGALKTSIPSAVYRLPGL